MGVGGGVVVLPGLGGADRGVLGDGSSDSFAVVAAASVFGSPVTVPGSALTGASSKNSEAFSSRASRRGVPGEAGEGRQDQELRRGGRVGRDRWHHPELHDLASAAGVGRLEVDARDPAERLVGSTLRRMWLQTGTLVKWLFVMKRGDRCC